MTQLHNALSLGVAVNLTASLTVVNAEVKRSTLSNQPPQPQVVYIPLIQSSSDSPRIWCSNFLPREVHERSPSTFPTNMKFKMSLVKVPTVLFGKCWHKERLVLC